MGASGLCTVTSSSTAGYARRDAGDALGDGLDEVDGIAAHGLDHGLGRLAVVHGAGEVVAGCRGGEVDRDRHVDHELLPLLALELEEAVVRADAHAGEVMRSGVLATSSHSATLRGRRARAACRARRARAHPGTRLRREDAHDRGRRVALLHRRAVQKQRSEEPLARRAHEDQVLSSPSTSSRPRRLPVLVAPLRRSRAPGRG